MLTLRRRLAAHFILLILLTAAAAGFVAVRTATDQIRQEVDSGLKRLLLQVGKTRIPLNAQILSYLKSGQEYEVVVVPVKRDAPWIATDAGLAKAWAARVGAARGPTEPVLTDETLAGAPYRAGRIARAFPGEEIVLLYPTTRLDALERQAAIQIAWVCMGVFGVCAIAATVLSAHVTRPLTFLVGATRKVAAGDLSTRVYLPTADEIEELGQAFNQMTEGLAKVQKMKVQAEKQELFERVAANIAHEIRNPLSAIRMKAQILRQEAEDPKAREELGSLIRECDRTETIVEELFGLSRPFELAKSPVDVNTLLGDVLALWELQLRHLKIEIIQVLPPDLPHPQGDAQRLRQVFVNLVVNAMQAMPHGGELTLRSVQEKSRVAVEVADTGVGIPEEIRGRVFEPFFTTKPRGTGLGLPFCKKVIEAHGGTIRFRTGPEGTCFRAELPLG